MSGGSRTHMWQHRIPRDDILFGHSIKQQPDGPEIPVSNIPADHEIGVKDRWECFSLLNLSLRIFSNFFAQIKKLMNNINLVYKNYEWTYFTFSILILHDFFLEDKQFEMGWVRMTP